MREGKTGTQYRYFTYDLEPRPDGKYHVGEGSRWGWTHKGAYKSVKAAKNWAVRQNHGNDAYTD